MPIPNENLYNVTKYYIENVLSLTHEEGDFECSQNDESVGPFISSWNEAKLGAQPTVATIMAHEAAWQTSVAANAYKGLRKSAILKEWPYERQLEALTEFNEDPSRPELMIQLLNDIAAIKTQYPKS